MKSIGSEQVARLFALAQEKSEKSRRLLVENIADLFLAPEGRLTEHQRMLMTDILYKLLSEVELAVRKELAANLAAQEAAIPELVKLLANDQIEIARPVLERSEVLRDQDLIEIIRMRSEEHRLSVAIRSRISEKVSEALIAESGPDVIEALLKNPNAEISERAMEYLVAESRRVDRFQEPLLSRHDLPQELAQRMFWWVSAALRRRILVRFSDLDVAAIDAALQDAAHRAMATQDMSQGTASRAGDLVARLADAGELTVQFLTRCLKQQKIPLFIAGLAHMSGLSLDMTWRIFGDREGEGFAVICKAIDMDRNEFASLFLFLAEARGGQRVRPATVLRDVLELFDAISVSNAQAALNYWSRDPHYQQALEEIGDAD